MAGSVLPDREPSGEDGDDVVDLDGWLTDALTIARKPLQYRQQKAPLLLNRSGALRCISSPVASGTFPLVLGGRSLRHLVGAP
jgi:hypothetical protein